MDHNSSLSSVKLWELFMEVYDMEDDYLIEEVLHLDYTNYDHIKSIITQYMLKGTITNNQRESLIGYYILSWHDGDMED